nr:hypothetical protein Iba_chr01fCG6560 [Ipomoea batatas]
MKQVHSKTDVVALIIHSFILDREKITELLSFSTRLSLKAAAAFFNTIFPDPHFLFPISQSSLLLPSTLHISFSLTFQSKISSLDSGILKSHRQSLKWPQNSRNVIGELRLQILSRNRSERTIFFEESQEIREKTQSLSDHGRE